jgi:hypothetical protein
MRVVLDRKPVERGIEGNLSTNAEGRYTGAGEFLREGDVLYVGRWWPSTLSRAEHRFQWTGPQNFSERIPLRHVDETYGSLRSYERAFLATVLAVQRSGSFNATDAQSDHERERRLFRFRNALVKNEVKIWNVFVRSLKAKIVDYSANGNLGAQGPELSDPNVFVTISTAKLQEVLDGITAPEDQPGHLYSNYIRVDQDERELFAIDEGFHSPWDSIIGKISGYPIETNAQFYAAASNVADNPAPAGVPHATFNFYDIDLDGTSMENPGDQERRWTLEDWNASDACRSNDGIPARIEQILLKGSTSPYRIVSDASATHEVELAFRRGRVVRVKPHACTACGDNIRSLPRSDLRRLYASDIRAVLWSYDTPDEVARGTPEVDKGTHEVGKSTHHVIRIPNCSPR